MYCSSLRASLSSPRGISQSVPLPKATPEGKYPLRLSEKEFTIFAFPRDQCKKVLGGLDLSATFTSITIAKKEFSIIAESCCEESEAYKSYKSKESGWRMFYIDGPIPFDAKGVLDSLVHPLTEISLLAISSFETDFILVKREVGCGLRDVGKRGFPLD